LAGLAPWRRAPALPNPICGQRVDVDWRSTK
jgi:hypothetical protein